MKSYDIDIYHELNDDLAYRYTLGKSGQKPLIAIGLNPSKATSGKTDVTVSKVIGFAERNGFDGFIMLNLYPQRATLHHELHEEINSIIHSENIKAIVNCLAGYEEVNLLAVWGETIKKRAYLKTALQKLIQPFQSEMLDGGR
ncbi:hypothetical protein GCM10023188_02330 [Pontibacter saemangeumensis]|uniref:DUF1643 domain-containing protein n=1 Tax=Pontibacter saemangeumensis TaxID=1084525 RepID=A0ABP8L789_9BACT